jgi:AcrR family transcriptional regulator
VDVADERDEFAAQIERRWCEVPARGGVPAGPGGPRVQDEEVLGGRVEAARGVDGVRRPRSDVARNRRLLVEAAIEAFQEHGWDVPLDAVARRAGVGNATLYRHFPTRDDLYEAAFAEIRERLDAVLARYRDVDDGWQALHEVIFAIYSTAPLAPGMNDPAWERLDTSPSLRWIVTEVRATLDRLLRLSQSQGSVRPDVDLEDLGLLLHSLRPIIVATAEVAPEVWSRHLTLLLDALRPGPASPLPARSGEAEERLRLLHPARNG